MAFRYLGMLALTPVLVALLGTSGAALQIGAVAPTIKSSQWINSPPLTAEDLSGQVVLVEFWTYG